MAGQTTVDTTKNYWIVKTDSSGSVQWDNKNNSVMDNFAYSLVQTKDYGYVLCGTADIENNGKDFLLVKVNAASSTSGFSSINSWFSSLSGCIIDSCCILAKRRSWLKRKEQV